jgi:hypothetical protein
MDPLVAESIRIATCDVWPLFLQHYALLNGRRSGVSTGEAMIIDEDRGAIQAAQDNLHSALRTLDLSSVKYFVVPQLSTS